MYPVLQGTVYEDLDLENGIPAVELLRRGWRLFFANSNLFLNYLVFLLLMAGSSALPFGQLIVGGPMSAGLAYQFLKAVRGEPININGLFDGFKLFGLTLAVYLLFTLIIFGGVLLCIIGAVIFSIWYFFLWYVVADGEREVWPTFVKSKELAKDFGWQIFVFMLVAGLFNMAGLLVCLVGLLVTAPITMLATAMLYDLMCAHKGSGIRDPEYMRQYWQQVHAGSGRPPVVGPLPEAQPVDQAPVVGPLAPPPPAPVDGPPKDEENG